MGRTDKQFCGFLRMLIPRLKAARDAKSPEERDQILSEVLSDLQSTLED